MGYELFDFGYVSASISEKFFNHLKKAVFDVLYDFYTFLYKMSYFGNREMDYLNEIMHNYTLLANIDSYKVFFFFFMSEDNVGWDEQKNL